MARSRQQALSPRASLELKQLESCLDDVVAAFTAAHHHAVSLAEAGQTEAAYHALQKIRGTMTSWLGLIDILEQCVSLTRSSHDQPEPPCGTFLGALTSASVNDVPRPNSTPVTGVGSVLAPGTQPRGLPSLPVVGPREWIRAAV